ncbi:glycosyltransferase [Gluconacetobacter sp. Hr-1-5]|uniref:glycosyltransferase n=1 Tax=Gluconacetobacter sp. Hr-1-5 TaxID=3395370 RepID=UPI003B528C0E
MMKIALWTAHLSAPGDPAWFDCAAQYRFLRDHFPDQAVTFFTDLPDSGVFPIPDIASPADLPRWCAEHEDGVLVVHYRDGPLPCLDLLTNRRAPVILRWHNATPPWFTFGRQNADAHAALAGYETIAEIARYPHIHVWCNSPFTREQFRALGGRADRSRVVFPAGHAATEQAKPDARTAHATSPDETTVLVAGRVAPHKGQINAIHVADRVKAITGRPLTLHFVGSGFHDPTPYAGALRDAIETADCTIVLHEGISQGTLRDLHARAHACLSLSEHEGFGDDVFGALRAGVPVVAWAVTALETLLDGHPFAFRHFDIDMFASAIAALRDPVVRSRVLDSQAMLLPRYRPEITNDQILAGLASVFPAGPQDQAAPAPEADLGEPSLERHPAILRQVVREWHRAAGHFPQSSEASLAYDSHINITSLHDLRLARAHTEMTTARRYAALATENDAELRIAPLDFNCFSAVITTPGRQSGSAGAARHYPARPLVSGPYIALPPGTYRVRFILDITLQTPGELTVDIEAVVNGTHVVGRDCLTCRPGERMPPASITFETTDESALVTFRIHPRQAFTGMVAFGGARLRNAHRDFAIKDETEGSENPPLPASDIETLLAGKRSRAILGRVRARRLFRAGNIARDEAKWAVAARIYSKGLLLQPDHFDYTVQCAHMLKETGAMALAERLYLRALGMRPGDPDLTLQLGHFYKIAGRSDDALRYYEAAAASLHPAASLARAELQGAGS